MTLSVGTIHRGRDGSYLLTESRGYPGTAGTVVVTANQRRRDRDGSCGDDGGGQQGVVEWYV